MAGEDDPSAMAEQILNGRDSGTDSGVIGDVKIVIQGNVEIDSNEHPLSLQISLLESTDALFGSHKNSLRKIRKKTRNGSKRNPDKKRIEKGKRGMRLVKLTRKMKM